MHKEENRNSSIFFHFSLETYFEFHEKIYMSLSTLLRQKQS